MRNTFVDYRCIGGRKRRRFPAPKNELQGEKGQAARAGGIPRSAARGTEVTRSSGLSTYWCGGDHVARFEVNAMLPAWCVDFAGEAGGSKKGDRSTE